MFSSVLGMLSCAGRAARWGFLATVALRRAFAFRSRRRRRSSRSCARSGAMRAGFPFYYTKNKADGGRRSRHEDAARQNSDRTAREWRGRKLQAMMSRQDHVNQAHRNHECTLRRTRRARAEFIDGPSAQKCQKGIYFSSCRLVSVLRAVSKGELY